MLAHVMALQQIVRQLDVLTRTVALLEDRLSHTEDKVRVNYHMPWNWTCQLLFVELNVADEIEDSEGHSLQGLDCNWEPYILILLLHT
jgi:hypothetical protein